MSWGLWSRAGHSADPSHTFELTNMMKRDHVKVINLVEPYFDRKTPDSIARETGGVVVNTCRRWEA